MFDREIYVSRRRTLLEKMSAGTENNGIAIVLGNAEAPQNYRGNDYKFRQESQGLRPFLTLTAEMNASSGMMWT